MRNLVSCTITEVKGAHSSVDECPLKNEPLTYKGIFVVYTTAQTVHFSCHRSVQEMHSIQFAMIGSVQIYEELGHIHAFSLVLFLDFWIYFYTFVVKIFVFFSAVSYSSCLLFDDVLKSSDFLLLLPQNCSTDDGDYRTSYCRMVTDMTVNRVKIC